MGVVWLVLLVLFRTLWCVVCDIALLCCCCDVVLLLCVCASDVEFLFAVVAYGVCVCCSCRVVFVFVFL